MSHGKRTWIRLNGLPYQIVGNVHLGTLPYVPEKRLAGYPTYADLSGTEMIFQLSSWHGGFGDKEHRGLPKFFHGYAVDGSMKGIIAPALRAVATTIPGSTGPFNTFVEFGSTLYVVGGRYVLSWVPATPEWTSSRDLGAGVSATDAAVFFALDAAKYRRTLYVANGTGAVYQEFSTVGGWVSHASLRAHRWAVLGNVLWRVTTDPTTSAWSAYSSGDGTTWAGANMVGQGDVTVNDLMAYNGRLLAITEAQMLLINPDGSAQDLFPGMRFLRDTNNGLNTGIDFGRNTVLVPVREGLIEYFGDFATNVQGERALVSVGPGANPLNDSVVRGRITCVAAGGVDVVYAGMTAAADTGTNRFYVLKRRLYPDSGLGDGWTPIARFSVPVTALFVERQQHGSGNPVLWIAVGNSSSDSAIYQVVLPRDNDNPFNDANVRWATTAQHVESSIDGGMRGIEKVWLSTEIHATIPSGCSIKASYQLENITQRTLGTLTADGFHTLLFPTNTVAHQADLVIDWTTNNTSSPRIHRIMVKAQLRLPRRRVWTIPVSLGDQPAPGDTRMASVVESDIIALQAASAPVSYEDRYENLYQVFVETPGIEQASQVAGESAEGIAVLKLVEWQPDATQLSFASADNSAARVGDTGSIDCSGGGFAYPTFGVERYDSADMHSTTSNPDRITVTVEGFYLITASMEFSGTGGVDRELQIMLNTSTIIAAMRVPPVTAGTTRVSVETLYSLSRDDYITVRVARIAGSGFSVNGAAQYSPELAISRVE